MHRIREDQFGFTEPRAPETRLRRLYNGRYLSDCLLQARASSQRARESPLPEDLQKSSWAVASGLSGLKASAGPPAYAIHPMQ